MWDILFWRHSFVTKCKSQLRMALVRIESIQRRRKAMQKFLKNDIADLLKSNLADNAYRRAEGLCVELTLSWCYDYIEHCCSRILNLLRSLQRESQCPEDCKVAIASIMYAAARFADLPDLRNLRDLFTEKYGNSLDSYVDIEFAENLRPPTPSTKKKLQLMRDIAVEYSIPWNSTTLENKLRNGSASEEQYDTASVGESEDTMETSNEIDYEDFSDLAQQFSPTEADHEEQHKTAATDRHRSQGDEDEEDDEDATPRAGTTIPPPYPKSSSKEAAGREGDEQRPQESSTSNSQTKTEFSLPLPPSRRPLYFPESRRLSAHYRADTKSSDNNSTADNRKHMRTFSLGSDRIMNFSEKKFFVHPKLPDYEELAHRMLSLRHN